MVYNVSITDRKIKLESRSEDTVGGNKGDTINFTFDEEWQGQEVKAAFLYNGIYKIRDVKSNSCEAPPIYKSVSFRLGVFVGNDEESTPYLSSTTIEIPTLLSTRDYMSSSQMDDEEFYLEALKVLDEIRYIAKNATDEAREEVTRLVGELGVVQTTGDSPTAVMSQRATTSYFAQHDKRITNLEQGLVPSPFEIDDSVAYIKDVPLNALQFAELSRVGGMTYKDGDTLKSANVTEIKHVGANLFNDEAWFEEKGFVKQSNGSWLCHSLNEPCWSNTRGRSGSMYINVVAKTENSGSVMYLTAYYTDGSGDVGCDVRPTSDFVTVSLVTDPTKTVDYIKWTYGSDGEYYLKGMSISFANVDYKPYTETYFTIPEAVRPAHGISDRVYDFIEWREDGTRKSQKCVGVLDMGTLDWNTSGNGFFSSSDLPFESVTRSEGKCVAYTVVQKDYRTIENGEMIINDPAYSSRPRVYVQDNSYRDDTGATFKENMSGVFIYYELATPEVTDISELLSADNYIGVEGGGTITAVNEYEYAVPTEITYQIKGA
jgi:hypothetical protein